MGSIHPYKTKEGKRYLVRYFKPDRTQAAKRGFKTKREAEAYLSATEVSLTKGDYVDPATAVVLIRELGEEWLTSQAGVLKPSTMHPVRSAWRNHVEPRWGERRLDSIRHSEVRTWVAELTTSHGAVTVIRSYGVLAAILDIAVRDRRIPDNPARGIRLPKKRAKQRVYLSHDQVDLLASASQHPDLVYFLAYTGMRWGEATALRVRDVDRVRRRVNVQENAVMVNGTVHVGSPKSHKGRSVPYPAFLDAHLSRPFALKSADQLLFGNGLDHMRLPNSKNGWFAGAVRRARRSDGTIPHLTPHDLRHTAASLAISAGANVKAVQRMLGHASAAMTLDTYSDLFDDDLDAVATALDRARDRGDNANG